MRERVGRISTALEVGMEKARRGPGGGRGGGRWGTVWTWRRWRWHGVEADAEEERAHSVNPTAVGEAIGKDPIVLEVWGDRGAGGCAGDGEMV
jgi:hypothetical protein